MFQSQFYPPFWQATPQQIFFKPAVNRRAKKIQPEVKNLDQHIMFDCPDILREFLFYLETIQGRSPKTVNG